MSRLQVLLLLLLASGGFICNAIKIKEKETKRTIKPVELKKIEKKSVNGKRESTELAESYKFEQKEEPFRPIYQFQYPGASFKTTANYVTTPVSTHLPYNKPAAVIPINVGSSQDATINNGDGKVVSGRIQYLATNSYKPEAGIQYAPITYKPGSEDGTQYASSAYRGPLVTTPYQIPIGSGRRDSEQLYSVTPVQPQVASLTLPFSYEKIEQPVSPQSHQENQYAIALPAEYFRNAQQQNLVTSLPFHSTKIVQLVYAHNSGQTQTTSTPVFKDQEYRQGAVQYVALVPHQGSHSVAAGSGVITHIVPVYGHSQQIQQPTPAAFYYGAYNQQVPLSSLLYTTNLPHQQQPIHKKQIYGSIHINAAADLIPLKPIAERQQLQQQALAHFYQHYHAGVAGYTPYSQSPSAFNGSGGSSSPVVPAYKSGSSSALKQGPLHSSPSLKNNPGNSYSVNPENSDGKTTYVNGGDPNYDGPMYAHPGALHYGTHQYNTPRIIVQIGSKPVTAGSAVIAGVSAPSFHPQQQSPANNNNGGRSSSVVMKFA